MTSMRSLLSFAVPRKMPGKLPVNLRNCPEYRILCCITSRPFDIHYPGKEWAALAEAPGSPLTPADVGGRLRTAQGRSDRLRVTTHPVLDGRWWTPVDIGQQVRAAPTDAARVSLCLRDEEANASSAGVADGSLTELP